jgi:hypothetical protein
MKPISLNIKGELTIEKILTPVFERFLQLFSERLNRIPILKIGEDSVRYDFFSALSEVLELQTWDLQLEYPVHNESYIPRNDIKSKRKENPQIDLVVSNDKIKTAFEFGLFKRNSNPNGTVNKTGRTLKMINDFVRLGLHKHYTNEESFFICVADSFMINHQMDSKIFDSFPAGKYYFTSIELERLRKAVKTDNFFDERFLKKAELIKLSIKADLIYESVIQANTLEHLTKIIIWKVNSEIES